MSYYQNSYLPSSMSAYKKRRAKEKLANTIEKFATRNYVIFYMARSKELPIIELFEGETIEKIFLEMKRRHKFFDWHMLDGGLVEITSPRQKRPSEGYAQRNLKWETRRIVEIGYKPQDERPPCRLFQLKLNLKRGRQPRKKEA